MIEPHYPVAGNGRRPYPLESMLRVHLIQNWFALSEPAMEKGFCRQAAQARHGRNQPATTLGIHRVVRQRRLGLQSSLYLLASGSQ